MTIDQAAAVHALDPDGVPPTLAVDHVSHSFAKPDGSRLPVLADVDVNISQGQRVALVGPSGCGKTTLLRILSGLVAPSEGTVRVNGKRVTGADQGLGYVFQNDRLLPWLTVRENVAFGLRARGASKRSAHARADEMISLVSLTGFGDSYPHQLSGGMRQRVNIARSLAIDPAVLLMDEPFAALDAQTREVMQEELVSIWDRAGSTVLFITHQIDEAVFLGDSVIVMRARPGSVNEVLPIELGRGRPLGIKRSAEFSAYTDRIWSEIEFQVRESTSIEMRGE
jgi:NitT/TauT family transport system ATP-binding protein